LLWTHVPRRAHEGSDLSKHGLGYSLGRRRFGESEIDNSRDRLAIHLRNQDVRRLEVAVDNRFLMRVLHSFADLDEQLQPFPNLQPFLIAVIGDRHAGHVLHDKVRLSIDSCPGVKHLGNRRMFHDGQRLAL
jgi:hypothetical protein